jgi:hypothetical protein
MSEYDPSEKNLPRQQIDINNVDDARRIIDLAQPVDTLSLLENVPVLLYGETHNDYSIPEFLRGQIEQFKAAGVTSFGFEITPDPAIQQIFDELNNGRTDRLQEIDWSLNWGNPLVRHNKEQLVRDLIKAGIIVYPFASWDSQGEIEKQPYSQQSEIDAADIISQHSKIGKTIVLIGDQHAKYGEGKRGKTFAQTADCLHALGIQSKSIIFAGGMRNPGANDRLPAEKLRQAWREKDKGEAMYINVSRFSLGGFSSDGIIMLPEVRSLAANEPMPEI